MTGGVTCGLTLTCTDVRVEDVAIALMDWPLTGMLFSRPQQHSNEPSVDGTLPMSAVRVDHRRAPDLYWVARASSDSMHEGIDGIGEQTNDGTVPVGGGMHGGLTRSEVNTMLAFGGAGVPRVGVVSDLADLTDIVPTLLKHLGVAPSASMSGRPLMATFGLTARAFEQRTIFASDGPFEQSITVRDDGRRSVVMEGRGRALGCDELPERRR